MSARCKRMSILQRKVLCDRPYGSELAAALFVFCMAPSARGCVRGAQNGLEAALDIGLGSSPRRDADTHRSVPLPDGASAPADPIALNTLDDGPGTLGATERYQHLVQQHLVQHPMARARETFGQTLREATASLDEVREPGATKLTKRRPHFDSAGTPREVK